MSGTGLRKQRWDGWRRLATAGAGAGFTLEQANEVGHFVERSDVLAYADAVHSIIQGWLCRLNDEDLDTVPDMQAHMAPYPAYQQPVFRAVIADLLGQPIWKLLNGPCYGHMLGHLEELDVLKQVKRAGTSKV